MVLLIEISRKYDQPTISTLISLNSYCIIYWWKTCFSAKFGPQKMEKWSFLKKIQKMISETIDSVNKIYFLTQIHCWMSGTILWNLILAQPGCDQPISIFVTQNYYDNFSLTHLDVFQPKTKLVSEAKCDFLEGVGSLRPNTT